MIKRMAQRLVSALNATVRNTAGQATVEYLVVGAVVIIVIVGVAALWRFVSGGGFAGIVSSQPSHVINGLGGAADVLLY